MDARIPFDTHQIRLATSGHELERCNRETSKYGISLSEQQMQLLSEHRVKALMNAERVEFGQGVLPDLVCTFAGSPYLSQDNFVETIQELLDLFYGIKNDSLEQIPDDELLEIMRSLFDDRAHGSLDHLAGTLLDRLCRDIRGSQTHEGVSEPVCWDEEEWDDDELAPGWNDESWSDDD